MGLIPRKVDIGLKPKSPVPVVYLCLLPFYVYERRTVCLPPGLIYTHQVDVTNQSKISGIGIGNIWQVKVVVMKNVNEVALVKGPSRTSAHNVSGSPSATQGCSSAQINVCMNCMQRLQFL